MGLDMNLYGKKWLFAALRPEEAPAPTEDGYEIRYKVLELGYWRKHPNLHGYIVDTFADGVDECQEISLGEEAIVQTIAAIRKKELPETAGFFFGKSDSSRDAESIAILENALKWLRAKTPDDGREIREVFYKASW
jgi:hypothetical protein